MGGSAWGGSLCPNRVGAPNRKRPGLSWVLNPAFKFANLGANLGTHFGSPGRVPLGPCVPMCVCIPPYGVWVPLYRGMAYGSPFDLGPLLSQPRKSRQRASSPTDGLGSTSMALVGPIILQIIVLARQCGSLLPSFPKAPTPFRTGY